MKTHNAIELLKDVPARMSRIMTERDDARSAMVELQRKNQRTRALLSECLEHVDGELAERIREVL